ncbi:MAG: hypothetical protein WA941_19700 [Nitrososphaeraceae archaeon]
MNTHKRLQSKSAIITGRGRGIGKETAIFMPILKKKLHLLYDLKSALSPVIQVKGFYCSWTSNNTAQIRKLKFIRKILQK